MPLFLKKVKLALVHTLQTYRCLKLLKRSLSILCNLIAALLNVAMPNDINQFLLLFSRQLHHYIKGLIKINHNEVFNSARSIIF
jgi:hypothetical protein